MEQRIQDPPGFSELSKTDQIRYLQALWDRIVESPGDLPVMETHLDLAESRLRHYRENPSEAHSAFGVLDRLTNRPK